MKWFRDLFKQHTECKVCFAAIKDGGFYVPLCGSGFCGSCWSKLHASFWKNKNDS